MTSNQKTVKTCILEWKIEIIANYAFMISNILLFFLWLLQKKSLFLPKLLSRDLENISRFLRNKIGNLLFIRSFLIVVPVELTSLPP